MDHGHPCWMSDFVPVFLFTVICEHLSRLKIISPLSFMDELRSLRQQHRSLFHRILHKAVQEINEKVYILSVLIALWINHYIYLSVPLSFAEYVMHLDVFLLHHFIISFGKGFPAYNSSHRSILREHILVNLNKFPFLICWCIVVHHHWLTLFQAVILDFMRVV